MDRDVCLKKTETENQILCAKKLEVFYVSVSSEMNPHLEGKLPKIQNILKGGEMSHPGENLLSSGGNPIASRNC